MRSLPVTSIGVTCAAALTLPLAAPGTAVPAPVPADATGTVARAPAAPAAEPQGSTQSLSLRPLAEAETRTRGGPTAPRSAQPSSPSTRGLLPRDSHRFSLVGVVWEDPDAELQGTVQVRTRATGTGGWSGWQDLETHNSDHAADAGSAERGPGRTRGSTAPLWVGDSDGVDVRVRSDEAASRHHRSAPAAAPLPDGLRVELVDPGDDPQPLPEDDATPASTTSVSTTATPASSSPRPGALPEGAALGTAATESSAADAGPVPLGTTEIPAPGRTESQEQAVVAAGAEPHVGPRPRIVTRKGWGADESLRERSFAYTSTLKAAFVHHSATGNDYTCAQAPSVLRGIYRYHVESSGWRDFGYNFAIDKCGTVYEGRAGGVTKAVLGAHTAGFNSDTMGIAVLGTFDSEAPPAAAVNAIARLTAWKLGLYGRDPEGKVSLVSGGGGTYAKGAQAGLHVISGHRDGFATECPGMRLYNKLGAARTTSAKLQGR
ncbi:N-acetylmuramoyl-L-alanine amidase [Streptomyces sp. NBC_01754]|uniref:N-acetylmuramoyl-L-alanine amidase n=1 Tax=Streptomyces sp. NBC_01754 TaxID=2975930 RepID=UPI002DD8AE24|nr:N-acetylmuramoyl-L-alanine amidase [Streptomyces sp. NBC_01754]WSC92811.1 N-acetylmuramoyl-L-alanine amidase [Streptomyces sp. NBC_01754]